MDRLSAADIKRTLADETSGEQRARLVQLLSEELDRLRASARLSGPAAHSREAALAQIQACFEARNLDLEALALLELHYLSPVQLTMREIARRVGLDERTLRRRQQRGYRYLEGRIAEAAELEQARAEARREARAQRHNLPSQRDTFVGRETDLSTLERLLQANRVVALVGSAGLGKTRLAVELGLRLAERFADGAWLLPLEHIETPEQLDPALATILGTGEASGPGGEDPVAWLAQREGLLILDRCEHMLPACGGLIARIVAGAPGIRIVATSRSAFGDHREATWPIGPLDLPPRGASDPETLRRHAAAKLFLDRMAERSAPLDPRPEVCEQVAELVHQLEGIPLAIELAAARATVLPLATVLHGQARSILRDAGGRAAEPSTPESVQRAIEVGLTDLGEDEHRLLARLAVFAGGFDMEAAQSVCADAAPGAALDRSRVLQILSRLLRRSLVVSLGLGIGRRYRLLEALRAYALDMLLRSGELEQLGRRHAERFADWIEAADAELVGPEVSVWMHRLAAEHDNLQAAFTWALRSDPPLALRIANGLARYRLMSGQLTVGRQQIQLAMDACQAGDRFVGLRIRLDALSAAGMMARQQCDFAAARPPLEQALSLARSLGEPQLLAVTLRRLGNVLEELGERGRAAAMYREAADLSRAAGDGRGLVAALSNLGILADHEGRHEEAVRLLGEALSQLEGLDAPWLLSVVYGNLANVLAELGRHEEARAAYRRSIEDARHLGDRVGLASLLTSLASSEFLSERHDQAWACLSEALPLLDDVADRQKAAEWLDYAARQIDALDLPEPAAMALGAADGLRERWSFDLMPKDRAWREALSDRVTRRLGRRRDLALRAEARSRRWQDVAAQVLAAAGRSEARSASGSPPQ